MAKIEVFSAGCKCCDDAIRIVKETMCASCELTVRNMAEPGVSDIAARYGVTRVPTVVVDGKVCGCCSTDAIGADGLRAAGVGKA